MARAEQAAFVEHGAQSGSTDLVASTSEVVGMMAPLASAKNVELAFEHAVGSAPVRAEASALRDIVTNLIDNAIRYNHDGGSVVVSVFADSGRYAVTVSDNGPGIAAEHRERVFDRFYRIPGAGRPAGSGLGLPIVKTSLQQCGGTALADGIDGRGLAVAISLYTDQRRSA
jgi:two-component system sensor histidine kinase TctE